MSTAVVIAIILLAVKVLLKTPLVRGHRPKRRQKRIYKAMRRGIYR